MKELKFGTILEKMVRTNAILQEKYRTLSESEKCPTSWWQLGMEELGEAAKEMSKLARITDAEWAEAHNETPHLHSARCTKQEAVENFVQELLDSIACITLAMDLTFGDDGELYEDIFGYSADYTLHKIRKTQGLETSADVPNLGVPKYKFEISERDITFIEGESPETDDAEEDNN